jgi:hypothetical protein
VHPTNDSGGSRCGRWGIGKLPVSSASAKANADLVTDEPACSNTSVEHEPRNRPRKTSTTPAWQQRSKRVVPQWHSSLD